MRIPSGCSRLEKEEIVDRVKGMIFGTILGDSLGLATENMSRDEVKRAYANGPIRFGLDDETETGYPFLRDTYRSKFDDNDFSDDAEQLLLVIQTLLENEGQFNVKTFAKHLKKYSESGMHGLGKPPVGMNPADQPAIFHPDFLSAPKKVAEEVWHSGKQLKGSNAALVRCLVLGASKFWDGTAVIENTTESCRVTNPDPRCMVSCVILSTLVARILRGQDLEIEQSKADAPLPSPALHPPSDGVGLAKPAPPNHYIDTLKTDSHILTLVHAVIDLNKRLLTEPNADPLFRTPETNPQRIQHYYNRLLELCYNPARLDQLQLDDHATDPTFKSLGAGVYAFTRSLPIGHESEAFKKILSDIVMQGGGADTNAALAGALLGVRIGYSRLPSEWVIGLKRWEWLEDRIEDFCRLL